jgi:hypothetical protein
VAAAVPPALGRAGAWATGFEFTIIKDARIDPDDFLAAFR